MIDQIFISYRRDDAAYVTGHINDLLRKEFGDEAVFTDVDNIALGVDFRAVLDTTVSQCQVLLAVIGSEWLNASDKDGHHRLQDPADFVRIEIESALKRNIPVIPLLVSGAKMPTEAELPESLRGLVFRNGTQIRPAPDFRSDMARLINNLRRHFDSIRQNEPATTVPDAGPGPESNNKPLPAESNSTQDSQSTQGEASEVMLQVGDDERVRKTAEFGQEQQSERRSTGLWRIAAAVVVVLADPGISLTRTRRQFSQFCRPYNPSHPTLSKVPMALLILKPIKIAAPILPTSLWRRLTKKRKPVLVTLNRSAKIQ